MEDGSAMEKPTSLYNMPITSTSSLASHIEQAFIGYLHAIDLKKRTIHQLEYIRE